MKVSCRFFEKWNVVGQFYCLGPPRHCHDCEEKAVGTMGGKFTPIGVTDISRRGKCLRVPPLWLEFDPPLNPPRPVFASIEDHGYLL